MKTYALLLLVLLAHTNFAQMRIENSQFETPSPSSATFTFFNPQMECFQPKCNENLSRVSVAQHWPIWLGTTQEYACVMTELVKAGSNCVPPWPNFVMGNMMHVKTTVGEAGIVNTNVTTEGKKARFSCWVYIIKGAVYFGMLNPACSASSSTKCRWVQLQFEYDPAIHGSSTQIQLYALKGDAEFYVDAVSVTAVASAGKQAVSKPVNAQIIKQ
jgi:hypothetical protein